tara:strand:+ start:1956 stop:2219 length:264 start_codon:yes stop_codon:yes gene_type:complete
VNVIDRSATEISGVFLSIVQLFFSQYKRQDQMPIWMTQMYAQQLLARSIPLRGGVQPVIRRMLRHNAIEAWETMQKSGGWKRCQPKW